MSTDSVDPFQIEEFSQNDNDKKLCIYVCIESTTS